MRTLRRVFPESFKREAVDGVVARGRSAPPPRRLIGPCRSIDLRCQNARLRMERGILKKPRSSSERQGEVRVG